LLTIRYETPADEAAVYQINQLAFDGRDAEPKLVEALRHDPGAISLVAEVDGLLVGHILFSRVAIIAIDGPEPGRGIPAMSLAPMAVLPGYQNRGIGSALARRGLDECLKQGHAIVIVLGHPEFYPRFGFSPALAQPLTCPFGDCGAAWMALELTPGALKGVQGMVKYPPAFEGV
jgi:putative acetyltransferase